MPAMLIACIKYGSYSDGNGSSLVPLLQSSRATPLVQARL